MRSPSNAGNDATAVPARGVRAFRREEVRRGVVDSREPEFRLVLPPRLDGRGLGAIWSLGTPCCVAALFRPSNARNYIVNAVAGGRPAPQLDGANCTQVRTIMLATRS
jgi:hypothetical protein